jgi:hypothetical protein
MTIAMKLDPLVKSHFLDFGLNDFEHLESRFWPILGFLRVDQAWPG